MSRQSAAREELLKALPLREFSSIRRAPAGIVSCCPGSKSRPHGLRHASLTAALDANNGDVRAVQQHARHASPQTTMRSDDNRRDLAGQVAASLANVL